MNIYENNKQLLTAMGGDSANLATDYEVRKAILELLGGDTSTCNSIYEVDKQILNIYLEGGVGTGGGEKAKVLKLDIDDTCIVDGTWGAEGIDTSLMTSFLQMFDGCKTLTQVDVSGWNTSNVTDMGYMFQNCSVLQTLDLSNWVTSKVTKMNVMFYGCSSLQTLDVSGWNTSNVTNMSNMFYSCSSLQTLDVTNFDTSNVTTMGSMFYRCSSLQTLDVSGWNTSNVTNMSNMFSGCSSLQTLDVSGWDTSNVTDTIDSIFYNCNNLNTLIGDRTIDEVISNNISALNGLKNTISFRNTILDRASLRAIINGLADLSSTSSQYLLLGSTLIAKLTEEDIAIATSKNWTISE